jgi:hypothetical protein
VVRGNAGGRWRTVDEFQLAVGRTARGVAFAADRAGNLYAAGTAADAANSGHAFVRSASAPPAAVVGRHVFYNGSAFDGNDAAANPSDDAAIATGKAPLLPGHTASFANVTSYTRGINGIMIDVSGGLPLTALAGVAAGVGLKAGAAGDPSRWADAPRRSLIGFRPGAGTGGTDRITLVWPDGAIRNTWLQVTVRALPQSGLSADDVFTFGSLVGETGDGAPSSGLAVSARDVLDTRGRRVRANASIENPYDHDRDKTVNVTDYEAARRNLGRSIAWAPPPQSIMWASGGSFPTRTAPTRRAVLAAGAAEPPLAT